MNAERTNCPCQDSNTARDTVFNRVLDVLIITRKATALGLFRIRRRKKIPLFPILKKKRNISGLFQETEKHI